MLNRPQGGSIYQEMSVRAFNERGASVLYIYILLQQQVYDKILDIDFMFGNKITTTLSKRLLRTIMNKSSKE